MDIVAPHIFLVIWAFLFGTIIGSFLNVVIYRFNSGAGLGGRSMCFSCGKTLRWYELIPVFSYLIQMGRCRVCRTKISPQYPLVELITGLLFAAAFIISNTYLLFIYLIVQLSLLVVIAVYDLRHKIIPDLFSYSFATFALVYAVYELYLLEWQWEMAWPNFLAGPIYFLPFAALFFFSRGRWMGFGDAKLAIGIGWFLGLTDAYISMLLSFWIGSIVGVLLILKDAYVSRKEGAEKITLKSEIPFGPFLILGLLLMLFFGDEIRHVMFNILFRV